MIPIVRQSILVTQACRPGTDQTKESLLLPWKLRMFAFKIKVDLTSATNMLQKALILKGTKEISSFLV